MAELDPSRWGRIRARKLADPSARERYERTRQSVAMMRQVLQVVDAERERAGLTKADLAHRVGVDPSAIRRMFTSDASNPTLRTILEVLDALGLEVTVRRRAPMRRSRASRGSPAPARSRAAAG